VHADGSVTMPGDRVPMGNAALISLGILGGVYLIYAIGWLIGGLRLQGRAQYLVTDIMYQGSLWLAVLAPLLWFATVFLLTLRAKPLIRFAWLIGGVVLLLPWPFVMIGAVGQ
ncbi:MAG TPA: DNA polymerase III subunit gamma/tau, partial [Microbacterium sp.]|nr:DNA polymerase III subunit gamma/tau [Microbacterium sp.]